MKNILILTYLFLSNLSLYGQSNKALLVAHLEFNEETGVEMTSHVVKYSFVKGKLHDTDTILSAPSSDVKFNFGYNRVYKNRYIISGSGNIIDIKNHCLVTEESDDLIQIYSDSVIFYRNNIYTGTGYFVFKPFENTYIKVQDSTYRSLEGLYSANLQKTIEVDYSVLPRQLWLNTYKSEKQLLLSDVGDGTPLNRKYSSWLYGYVPVCWINDFEFAYVDFNTTYNVVDSAVKTSSTAEIKISDLDGNSKSVCYFNDIEPAISQAKIYSYSDSMLVFYHNYESYTININTKVAEKKTISNYGYGFQALKGRKKEKLFYNGKVIKKLSNLFWTFRTTENYIVYLKLNKDRDWHKYLYIWSADRKRWIKFTSDENSEYYLIGWIDE